MKHHPLHPHSPFRIFAVSSAITLLALVGVLLGKGPGALLVAIILIAVEVSFSFDNAIVNAKVLSKMSSFWQNMFLTVGALIAIFGMRIVFPIVIVALTADLALGQVLDLALNHPKEYAHKLEESHAILSSFGGAFLLMLALHFFLDDSREVLWFRRLESRLQYFATSYAPALVALILVGIVSWLPFNHHQKETLVAGVAGVVLYSVIHALTGLFDKLQRKRTKGMAVQVGMAAFVSFIYLEILDASFSFDSVLGAFAITQDVVLIAIGLGVGAFWVRSLTVFMVRRGTLNSYRFIDHGAHYTIGVLACILFVSIFVRVPEIITGMAGIGIIAASIVASRQALAEHLKK